MTCNCFDVIDMSLNPIPGSSSFDLYQVANQFAGVEFYEGIVDLCLAAADRLV